MDVGSAKGRPMPGHHSRLGKALFLKKGFFPPESDTEVRREFPMDKATKTQLSVLFFVIGLAMIFMQDLKRLDTINLGFSLPFAIMFYIGLIFMVIGYYLK